jgi:hypothetical protein
VEPEGESGSFVRVFSVCMDLEDEQFNLTVDSRFWRARTQRTCVSCTSASLGSYLKGTKV